VTKKKKAERPVETPDGRLRNPGGTLKAIRGADGRRRPTPIYSAPRLSPKNQGWAADTGKPRGYTQRQIEELARQGIDVTVIVDGETGEQRPTTAEQIDDFYQLIKGGREEESPTNDAFEGEVVPTDPRREADFRKMIAAAEREIAAEKAETKQRFGVMEENHWFDEVAIKARDRHPVWRGKGDYPTAVEKVKSKKGGSVVVTYGPTPQAVRERHGRDPYAARRAAEALFERHGLKHRLEPPADDATVKEKRPVGRPKIYADKTRRQAAHYQRKKEKLRKHGSDS
jgi:hypothetical protein